MTDRSDIEANAAQWLMRREQPDWTSDDERDFQSWLDASLAHKAAFWRLEAAWESSDRLAAVAPQATASFRSYGWRSRAAMAMAASLVLLCGVAIAFRHHLAAPPVSVAVQELRFATPVGGRKDITLSDGSHVLLNTATAVRISIGRDHRQVWLDRGEAFFDVAHDRNRPFAIYAGADRVTVLGTRFALRRDPGRLRVAVERGAVRVGVAGVSADDGPPNTVVAAGQTALVQDKSVLLTSGVDTALSWLNGTLTFDQTTIEQAANEFNRYNRRQIRLQDDVVRQLRIGGSFRAGNVDAFVRLLHEALGLRVTQGDNEIIISS